MDLREKLRGTYSGSRAEENAALSVSPLQLYPALAKDMVALPHHLTRLGCFPKQARQGLSALAVTLQSPLQSSTGAALPQEMGRSYTAYWADTCT